MKLWALVTVKKNSKEYCSYDSRCVGIYTALKLAKKVVKNNYGDIYEEGYYPLVVIEAKETDELYAGCLGEQYWFKWEGDSQTGKYLPIAKPDKYKNIIGWGIG